MLSEIVPFAVWIVGSVEHLAVDLVIDIINLNELIFLEGLGIAESKRVVARSTVECGVPDTRGDNDALESPPSRFLGQKPP